MRKIYVVGYEPINDNCVGGFDWFPTEEDATKCFDDSIATSSDSHITYRGTLEVDENLDGCEVTDFVDNFLAENNWDKAFNKILCGECAWEGYKSELGTAMVDSELDTTTLNEVRCCPNCRNINLTELN